MLVKEFLAVANDISDIYIGTDKYEYAYHGLLCNHLELKLRKLRKNELIEYYRTLEKNWFGLIEAKNIQFENLKKMLREEYCKAVDDFANGISDILEGGTIYNMDCVDKLSKQLKDGRNNEQMTNKEKIRL